MVKKKRKEERNWPILYSPHFASVHSSLCNVSSQLVPRWQQLGGHACTNSPFYRLLKPILSLSLPFHHLSEITFLSLVEGLK